MDYEEVTNIAFKRWRGGLSTKILGIRSDPSSSLENEWEKDSVPKVIATPWWRGEGVLMPIKNIIWLWKISFKKSQVTGGKALPLKGGKFAPNDPLIFYNTGINISEHCKK